MLSYNGKSFLGSNIYPTRNDGAIVFEIEYVGQYFDDYVPVHLDIWRAFTDTTMSNLAKSKEEPARDEQKDYNFQKERED